MHDCLFCSIVAGSEPASVVYQDEHTIAFMDPRQFHPGHLLVIPKAHVPDIRSLRAVDAGPLMLLLAAAGRAVDAVFPADGLSIWHSAGPGANQEVPHLHFHVHPRVAGDDLLRVYPSSPTEPARAVLDARAAKIRPFLEKALPEIQMYRGG